ncbi:MAG TPA: hypothetical protein VFB78_14565 [Acidimicrobiales bacterium]|jgi:uncharacterized integral membrane protein|nr:hypothetical protein [Acidimicrobiales bacterium]
MADEQPTPKPERKEQARLAGAVILVVVIAALAFDNRQDVRIGYVIGDAHVRLVYLLLVTAALGAVAGRLARRRRKR